jgi:hypothetical protein
MFIQMKNYYFFKITFFHFGAGCFGPGNKNSAVIGSQTFSGIIKRERGKRAFLGPTEVLKVLKTKFSFQSLCFFPLLRTSPKGAIY